jgi:hypothetical protein
MCLRSMGLPEVERQRGQEHTHKAVDSLDAVLAAPQDLRNMVKATRLEVQFPASVCLCR